MKKTGILLLSLLISQAGIALAAAPSGNSLSADPAQQLAQSYQQWLQQSGVRIGTSGNDPITVAPQNGYSQLMIPALAMDIHDMVLHIPTTQMNATPAGDQMWDIQSYLPSMQVKDKAGKLITEIKPGNSRIFGRWSEIGKIFVKVQGAVDGFQVTEGTSGKAIIIGDRINLNTNLNPDATGKWSGPGDMIMRNVRLFDETGIQLVDIGNIAVRSTVTGMDLAAYGKLNDMAQELETMAEAQQNQPNAKPDMQAVTEMMRTAGSAMSAIDGTVELQQARANFDNTSITVPRLMLGYGFKAENAGTGSAWFAYAHQGLGIAAPQPVMPNELLPRDISLRFLFAGIPTEGLMNFFAKLATAESSASGQEALEAEAQKDLLDLLAKSPIALKIERLRIDTPAASADAAGEVKYDASATLKAVGGVNITLGNLDQLVETLRKDPNAPMAAQAAGGLAMIQAMGQQGKDDQGRPARIYKIEITKDGRTLLNGADMSAMLGGGGQ